MSAAKTKPKRWAIVPPSSAASDAASRHLGAETDGASPATLRSRPGLELGPRSGARDLDDASEPTEPSAPLLSRRQRRRSQRPAGVEGAQVPQMKAEQERLELLRARETLGHERLAPPAGAADGTPLVAATWMSPGMSAAPARVADATVPEPRPQTARRRVDCPTTLTSLPDMARAGAPPVRSGRSEEAPGLLGSPRAERVTLRSPAESLGGPVVAPTQSEDPTEETRALSAESPADRRSADAVPPGSQEAGDTIPAPPWLGDEE